MSLCVLTRAVVFADNECRVPGEFCEGGDGSRLASEPGFVVGECENTLGGHVCVCPPGYAYNETLDICQGETQ